MSSPVVVTTSLLTSVFEEVIQEYSERLAMDVMLPIPDGASRISGFSMGSHDQIIQRSFSAKGKAGIRSAGATVIPQSSVERQSISLPVAALHVQAAWDVMEAAAGMTANEDVIREEMMVAQDVLMKACDDLWLLGEYEGWTAGGSFARQAGVTETAAAAAISTYTSDTAGTLFAEIMGEAHAIERDSGGNRMCTHFVAPSQVVNTLEVLIEQDTSQSLAQRMRMSGIELVKMHRLRSAASDGASISVFADISGRTSVDVMGDPQTAPYAQGFNYFYPIGVPMAGFNWNDTLAVRRLKGL